MPYATTCLGLLRRRQLTVLTSRGWAVLFCSIVIAAVQALRGAYPFLAVNDPQPGGALVVDGGTSDPGLNEAIAEFRRHHYDKVYVTGGPLLAGALLSEYPDFAAEGAARLRQLGLAADSIQVVPAPRARSDAIYEEAAALADWLRRHNVRPTSVNLVAEGPNARRFRLMFEKALGKGVRIGVVALRPRGFDPAQWWQSSEGVRSVTSEILAYFYARCFF